MPNILLREITMCSEIQVRAVRDIRNQENIRTAMYTEHEISLDEHLAWVESLRNDKNQIIFTVLENGVVRGVVSVNSIDRLHLKSDWAFYLESSARGGLGAFLEFSLIDFVFGNLGLQKLNCEVLETNAMVVKMHKRFGFVEEGFRRENVVKGNERIGVYFLGLTKADWLVHKDIIKERYDERFQKYNLEIEYDL